MVELALVSRASLPRFIALQSHSNQTRHYLTLQINNGFPYLTFSAQQRTRLAVHEVLYNVNEEGVVMIRAPNGRFWQRNSSNYIVADREPVPTNLTSDPACYFKVYRRSDGHLVFQSLLDNRYLKRYTSHILHSLHASASASDDVHAALPISIALDAAVILPRYIMLFGDNQRYVGDHHERKIDWLKFNKDTPRLAAAHQVIPLLDGNFAILNMNLQKFWRRSPNWIWADVATLSSARDNKDCHFDVLKLSSTLISFMSIANDRLLKRYTEYWQDMLCAIGTTVNDPATRFTVHEAVLKRSFFDIKYLLALAEVTDITPVLVGSGTMLNDTDFTTELEVQVTLTQEVANTQKWSTSSTFSTSLTVGFSVGVPEVHSVDGSITVSQERTVSTEMGSTITEAIQFQTTFKVPQVPPRTEVKVTVECTTARLRVPFTYSSRDIRIDGIDMPTVLDNVDGIFEGVNAFSIRGVVTTVEDNTFRSPTACSPPPLPDTQGHQLFKCAIG